MFKYLAIAMGASLVISGFYWYHKGYSNARDYYEKSLNEAYVSSLQNTKKLLIEQDAREKYIVSSYITQITQLKETQENEINSIKSNMLSNTKRVSDSNKCSTRVSSKVNTRSNTICYTEAELLRKIKESMAIAGECDQLAVKYNTLLSICK